MSNGNGQADDWFSQNAPAATAAIPTGSSGAPKAPSTAVSSPASPQAIPSAQSPSGGDWFAKNAPPQQPAQAEPDFWSTVYRYSGLEGLMKVREATIKAVGPYTPEYWAKKGLESVSDWAKSKAAELEGQQIKAGATSTGKQVEQFGANVVSDTARMGAGILDPNNQAIAAATAGAPEIMGPVLVAHGGVGVYKAATDPKLSQPEAVQEGLTSAAEMVGGAAATGGAIKSAVSNPLGETMRTPRGTTAPENFTPAELKAYADQNNIPLTAAQVTENVGARAVQSSGERAVVGGSEVKAGIKAGQDAIASHAQDMADSFSPKTPDLASRGAAIQKNVQTALDTQLTKADTNYAKVDAAAQGTTVDLQPVKDTADRVLSDSAILQKAGLDPKTATRVLKGIDSLDKDASFSDAQKLRSALLDLSRSPELAISTTAQGMLKQVIGATDQAMMDAAQGTPELQKAFRDANAHYERIQEDLNSPRSPLNQILSEPDPSKVPQKLTQKGQIGGSPYNAGLLDTYGIDKGPVKATIVEDLLNRNFGMHGKTLGGYSDDFLRSIFTPQELSDLYKTGVIARSVGLNTNPSGTAAVSAAIEQTKHPILSAIPQTIAAKFTTSPHFNNWLMGQGVIPRSTAGARTAAVAAGARRDNEE
jgi:hypothetical protein